MVRQRGESGSTGPAPGPDATPSPTTAVAALMGFDTGRDVPAARSPPPASSAATREGTPRRGDEHPTSSSSPMTDILNVFAADADAAPRAPPAGAGASQAAANVSAIIRAAAEAAVAASAGREKRPGAGRTSSRASSRAPSATASATASPARPEKPDAGEYVGYSLAHTPRSSPRRDENENEALPNTNTSFESAFAALTAATGDARATRARARSAGAAA